MTRQQYLNQLRSYLSSLPVSEVEDVLIYYQELFDEESIRADDQILTDFRSPQEAARQVLQGIGFDEVPLSHNRKRINPWIISVALITLPVWSLAPLVMLGAFLVMMLSFVIGPVIIIVFTDQALTPSNKMLLVGLSFVGISLLWIVFPMVLTGISKAIGWVTSHLFGSVTTEGDL